MTDKLSPETIARICHLNTCLTEAAKWTQDRAKRTLTAYFAGGGTDWQQQGDYWEDYELEAVIKCSLGNDDPACNPDDEYANLIAATETRLTRLRHETEDDDLGWSDCIYNWNEGLPDIDVFRQTQFCWLFHDIFVHTLHRDFDALMRIGELEINLVLTRQRGVSLATMLLPKKRKSSYPRSVFSQTPCSKGKYNPLTYRELRYARLLNQKMSEARAWIEEQARRSEKEYADIGGRDCCLTEGNAYEDYELLMEVCGCLGENHPEYDENEDGIVVRYSEPIYKENQRIFGRSRNPFHHNRYHYAFRPAHHYRWGDEFNKIQPCGLFWDIFEKVDRDWLKMLSIGQLWLDVFFVQRRIVHV